MTPALSRHIRKEVTVNGLSNAFFNGVIAWWLLKDIEFLQWWGKNSFAIDVLATAFILPFIVALIVVPLAKRKKQTNPLLEFRPESGHWATPFVIWFPHSLFLSATIFGLIGLGVMGSFTLLCLKILGIEYVDATHYSIFKGIWSGFIASCLAGPMIMIGTRSSNSFK